MADDKKAFDEDKVKEVLRPRLVDIYKSRVEEELDIYSNTLDPFSAVLDAKLLDKTIEEWIEQVEIPRQTQKTLQNHIGEMHQEIIATLDGWEDLGVGGVVDNINHKEKILAEIKNKWNSVNATSALGSYDGLDSKIRKHSGFTGYHVVMLPKNGRYFDKEFTPPDNKTKMRRPFREDIRTIDGKSFYKKITGQEDAYEQLYDLFPTLIDEILLEDFDIDSSTDLGEEKRKSLFKKVFPDHEEEE